MPAKFHGVFQRVSKSRGPAGDRGKSRPRGRPRRRLSALAALASLVALVAHPAPVGASVVTSGTITLFNSDPYTLTGAPVGSTLPLATPDYAPSTAMVNLVNNTPAGALIHLANFYIDPADDGGIINALNGAAGRGVNVSVVLDNQTGTSRGQAAQSVLNPAIAVTLCAYACINTTGASISGVGIPGIQHSKFILFSSTVDQNGTARTNVVANGSQNFNRQQFIIHNNWVVSYNDAALYTGFLNYWNAMDAQNATPTNSAVSATITSSGGLIRTYFSPRASTSDPIADLINELDCSRGGKIYASSSTWSADRTSINGALMNQADAGCVVQLIMDQAKGPESNTQANLNDGANDLYLPTETNRNMNSNVFGTHGITVYGSTPGGCRYSTEGSLNHYCMFTGGGSHEKFLVVDGKSSSGSTVKKVSTGSMNFTQRALTSYTEAIKINPTKYPNAAYSTVNSAASGSQDMPSAARVTNYTAIAWADNGNPTVASLGKYGAIYLKLMRTDGTTVYEVPIQAQAAASSGSDYRSPSVGIDSSGNAVVAWQDDDDANGSYNVVMRSVTNNGTSSPTVGSRVYAHTNGNGEQLYPSLSMAIDGHFSVAFVDDAASNGNTQIRMSSWTSISAKVIEMQMNGTSTGTHTQPKVSVYPTSGGGWNSVVVWNDDSDGNTYGDIRGRAVTSSGSSVWAEKTLNANGADDQSVPKVSANAGGFVAAWITYRGSAGAPCHTYSRLPGADPSTPTASGTTRCVQVREFNASGTAATTEFEVSKGLFSTNAYTGSNAYSGGPNPNPNIGDQRSPSVAIDSAGDYVVSWQEQTPYHPGWDIYARGFTAGGGSTASTLSEYKMNPVIPNNQLSADVASDPSGNFWLVYTDDADRNGSTQLMLRRGFFIN
jgi:hypothetical protein